MQIEYLYKLTIDLKDNKFWEHRLTSQEYSLFKENLETFEQFKTFYLLRDQFELPSVDSENFDESENKSNNSRSIKNKNLKNTKQKNSENTQDDTELLNLNLKIRSVLFSQLIGRYSIDQFDTMYYTLEYDYKDWKAATKTSKISAFRNEIEEARCWLGDDEDIGLDTSELDPYYSLANSCQSFSKDTNLSKKSQKHIDDILNSEDSNSSSHVAGSENSTSQNKKKKASRPQNRELRNLLPDHPSSHSWNKCEFEGQQTLYEALDKILTILKEDEHATPFLKKVSKQEAPDYENVIKNPMDLGLMTRTLYRYEYASKKQFQNDLNLIFSNCRKFNTDPDSAFYLEQANKLEKISRDLMKDVEDIDFSSERDQLREKQRQEKIDKKYQKTLLKIEKLHQKSNEQKKLLQETVFSSKKIENDGEDSDSENSKNSNSNEFQSIFSYDEPREDTYRKKTLVARVKKIQGFQEQEDIAWESRNSLIRSTDLMGVFQSVQNLAMYKNSDEDLENGRNNIIENELQKNEENFDITIEATENQTKEISNFSTDDEFALLDEIEDDTVSRGPNARLITDPQLYDGSNISSNLIKQSLAKDYHVNLTNKFDYFPEHLSITNLIPTATSRLPKFSQKKYENSFFQNTEEDENETESKNENEKIKEENNNKNNANREKLIARNSLEKSLAIILAKTGFQGISGNCLSVLVDVIQNYFQQFLTKAKVLQDFNAQKTITYNELINKTLCDMGLNGLVSIKNFVQNEELGKKNLEKSNSKSFSEQLQDIKKEQKEEKKLLKKNKKKNNDNNNSSDNFQKNEKLENSKNDFFVNGDNNKNNDENLEPNLNQMDLLNSEETNLKENNSNNNNNTSMVDSESITNQKTNVNQIQNENSIFNNNSNQIPQNLNSNSNSNLNTKKRKLNIIDSETETPDPKIRKINGQ